MKTTAILLLAALTISAQTPPAPKPEDVHSLDAIVKAVYDVISGPAGQTRDWDRMRSLFYPGARLIPARPQPDGGSQATMLTVEEFITRSEPALQKGFFESEIRRETQSFGNIAHVWSTYQSRHAKGEAPFSRGINSMQLLKDGGRWWLVDIYWDSERLGNPLPR